MIPKTENHKIIAEALERIQETGGSAVFMADQRKNYFIEFAVGRGEIELFAEAVGNEYLEPANKLKAEQIFKLKLIGWKKDETGVNFCRYWAADTYKARLTIAEEVMRTFVKVYGVYPDTLITVELNLD